MNKQIIQIYLIELTVYNFRNKLIKILYDRILSKQVILLVIIWLEK
jgi:hypothetical protein